MAASARQRGVEKRAAAAAGAGTWRPAVAWRPAAGCRGAPWCRHGGSACCCASPPRLNALRPQSSGSAGVPRRSVVPPRWLGVLLRLSEAVSPVVSRPLADAGRAAACAWSPSVPLLACGGAKFEAAAAAVKRLGGAVGAAAPSSRPGCAVPVRLDALLRLRLNVLRRRLPRRLSVPPQRGVPPRLAVPPPPPRRGAVARRGAAARRGTACCRSSACCRHCSSGVLLNALLRFDMLLRLRAVTAAAAGHVVAARSAAATAAQRVALARCVAVAQRGADRRVDDAFALPRLDVPPPLPLGVLQRLDVPSCRDVPPPLPLGVLLRMGVVPRRDVVPRQLWAQRGH